MIQQRKFHVPGEDKKKAEETPVVFRLGFDTTNEVKYESMKNHVRHGRLYRRHRDLSKECEKQIRSYERVQQSYLLEQDKCKQKVEDRLTFLLSKTTDFGINIQVKYSYNEWTNAKTTVGAKSNTVSKGIVKQSSKATKTEPKDKRNVLLFSVTRKDGADKYYSAAKGLSRDDSSLNGRRPPVSLFIQRELTM